MTVKLHGTSPKILPRVETIDYKSFNFSAGEIQVRLPDISSYDQLIIESRYPSSADLIEVLLIYNAINQSSGLSSGFRGSVTLFLPYLPYSRQDRACYSGEAFSLSVLAKLIGTQSLSIGRVVTWDVHSDISQKTFREAGIKFVNVSTEDLLGLFLQKGVVFDPKTVVVAPDKGARLRASLAARAIGSQEVYFGEKERDPNDGSITSIKFNSLESIPPNFNSKHILIADDICDGGRTFIELAKVIQKDNPASITLYVTHGIFSKGFEVFYDNGKLLIDRILTPNPFPNLNLSDSFTAANTPEIITLN